MNTYTGHVHCLPDDVLGEIFMETREIFNAVPSESYANDRNPHCIWTLSRVCARWNHATRGYPLLWSKIVIILKPHIDDIVKLYLERSQGAPLAVSVGNVPGVRLKVEWDAREALFDVLVNSMPRWQSLDLSDAPSAFNSTYVYRLFAWPRKLKSLECLIAPTFNVLSRCPSLSAQDAPLLRTLHISDMNIAPDGPLTCPFEQIETLIVTTRDRLSVGLTSDFVSVSATISHFPHVKEVRVMPRRLDLADVHIVPGVFQTITCLTLLFSHGYTDCWPQMRGISLPYLLEMNIQWVPTLGQITGLPDWTGIGELIMQTSKSLRILRMENVYQAHKGDCVRLLRHLPGLTHLVVREPVQGNRMITEKLIDTLGQADFLPLLEGVELIWHADRWYGVINEMEVVLMLEKRGFRHSSVGCAVAHNLEDAKAKEKYISLLAKGLAEFHYL